MKDVVDAGRAGHRRRGSRWVPAAELGFAYRTCRLPPGAVVTRVELPAPAAATWPRAAP